MVAVKMGGPMPPMGGMPPPMPLPPPMPVPPMGNPMMPPQSMPMQQGAVPVAPQLRSNAGRRKRFGDSLEGMLASRRPPMVASDQMGGMNIFTGQMPRRPMPRAQMMGGTAMQPPVRRMMGGGAVPRRTDINGQDHMLAYIRPDEADLLKGLGGAGTPGPGGIPQFGFLDFMDRTFGTNFTGGSSSSSSSQSYTQPSNDPYAEDRPSTSQSSADAGKQYAETMIAGGGGTNLSGSGSTAMEKLLADQKAQTQKDDGPPPDVTGSSYTPGSIIASYENREVDPAVQKAKDVAAQKLQEYLDNQKSQAAQEASFNQPDTQVNTGVIGGYDTIGTGSVNDPFSSPDDASNIDIFTTGDVVPIGDPSDASNIDLLTTLPVTGGDDNTSPNEQEPINLDPVFYDMFGNPYKTQAEAAAADAEHLRKQQEAAAAETQRLALEEEARIQAEVAAREAKEQAERERIAKQAAAEAQMGLDPFGGGDIDNVAPLSADNVNLPEDVASALSNIVDPINEGLGKDISLDKAVTDATEEEDDRNFIQKFIDDIKDVPGNIVNDITMALDAGFFGGYDKMIENLKNAKNPDGTPKYTQAEIDDYIKRTKDTQQKQRDQQERDSARDDDGGSKTIVDPCPEGMRLDPVAGICVPVEDTGGDDTEEEDTDEKEDTSDDELSGVVVTPPPPTSYLDNKPIRAMNRGGSVGLNRAADNFLAAMGG